MVRIVVVDDEALVRRGFELMLGHAPDIEVVAAVPGGEAYDAVTRHQPDVVLLDIRMPDVDGLTLLDKFTRMPSPPVVAMLTTFDSDEYIAHALRRGASGFLVKDTDPEQLVQLVRTLAEGGVVLSPKVATQVVSGFLGGVTVDDLGTDKLSPREREVLVLVADGLSNLEIGRVMHLSVGTVKDHVSALLGKLGVANRVQAALVAQRAGLLEEQAQ
ncbi:response regulator [Tsukamurella strandjordii]|uniref:Response regulator transcription factor n=1 Tax=Tsukamurella strandjordii TaxID=147577 RepID=A0AA90NT98_9ACTN|nr:response regulator transcription factor [Tsukamurella strandjordii]MDP0400504.1 response regulator transcription factor [Tsukamurella strandjordii]